MADPNWLYSSTAQSGAAIVAIIGGFLSARLLGLQSEKASLDRQIADKRARAEALDYRAFELRASMPYRAEELTKVEAELSMTREETRVLEERAQAFSYPRNLWFGFIALVYLAAGGVVVPLVALPRGSDPAALRIAVLTLFVSGVAAVFAFLASQIMGITAGGQRRGDGTSTGLKLPK